MSVSYNLISDKGITGANTRFLRVEPTSFSVTLREIFESLIDLTWLNQFRDTGLYVGFKARLLPTVECIERDFQSGTLSSIDKDAGELFVSELARQTVVTHLGYFDIPLCELFKEQRSQNPGFDFLSMNSSPVFLFGEAKYQSGEHDYAYKKAIEQIQRFITEEKDLKEIPNLSFFIPYDTYPLAYSNMDRGLKGFIAAFSCKSRTDQEIIDSIKEIDEYKSLEGYDEVICIAVNI